MESLQLSKTTIGASPEWLAPIAFYFEITNGCWSKDQQQMNSRSSPVILTKNVIYPNWFVSFELVAGNRNASQSFYLKDPPVDRDSESCYSTHTEQHTLNNTHMIDCPNCSQYVKPISVLTANPDTVKALVSALIVSVAEGCKDMVLDYPNEYDSKRSIDAVFDSERLRQIALEEIDDHLADLHHALRECLKTAPISTRVVRMDYGARGDLVDIGVDINVN